MIVSHNWLQTYFDQKIPTAENLAELFTFHSFEVEGMENLSNDSIIDAKVLPDRAHYALSHKGIAGEVYALTGIPLKIPKLEKIEESLQEEPVIKILNPDFCRRMISRHVKLPKNKIDPIRLKTINQNLLAVGQRLIHPIVDLTNYVMLDVGQPLHAFDAKKIQGEIVVRYANEGEKITLLDGRKIILSRTVGVIADESGPLDIAGIKGGKRAEINESTEEIIIVSDNFDPVSIRRTANKYNLRNEASKRFENEITPGLCAEGMEKICSLIKELMPEALFGRIIDEYPVKPKQVFIEFDPSYIEERLGTKIPLNEAEEILKRLNIEIEKKDKWTLKIPFERYDLTIPEDVVEEIGRIYGYDHIQGKLPEVTNKRAGILLEFYLSEKIKNIMVGIGFSEVSLYTLVSRGEIEAAHPLAKDKAFARRDLTGSMIDCVEKNSLNADLLGLDEIKIFEIGRVFSKDSERTMLSIGASQIKKIKGRKGEDIIKEAFQSLVHELNINVPEVKIITKGSYSVCEIDLDEIVKSYIFSDNLSYSDLEFKPASENKYHKFSAYPFIVRDIAVFMPEGTPSEELLDIIKKEAGELLVRTRLFDVFTKDGKASYAYRLVFQSMERTLTDTEVNSIMEKIYYKVKERGWIVR